LRNRMNLLIKTNTGRTDRAIVEVYRISGSIVASVPFSFNKNNATIVKLEQPLAAGLYYFRIKDEVMHRPVDEGWMIAR
jgi:hypothetical protein